jgi:DNA-binding response OmpR family regulator
MMIVLVETRPSVAKAYIDGLDRLGVAGLHFEPEAFHDWIANSGVGELSALEAVIIGDVEGREALPRALLPCVSVPLIALLDKRTLEVTLSLFAAGYDDVIGKPVHVQEILARINRASARRQPDVSSLVESDLIVFADGRDPLVKGEVLVLPRRERRILECLYQNQGAWLTKTQIFNRVYGLFNDQYDESVVESHICLLRRRLKTGLDYDPVESQRYLGYRLKISPHDVVQQRPASLMQSQLGTVPVTAS